MRQSVNKFFTPASERINRYYIDDFDPERNPENNYVAILSEHIPENARVLDLGCAQGRFSSVLNKKNCYAVGVELDSVAAECAKKTGAYDTIYIGDMIDNKSDIYKELCTLPKFDVIIMTDVLEHVVEPTEMIRMYYSLLNVDGIILISIPNFANIKVVLQLLNNQIAYEDMGILDNTHLKWYTKISFVQWIDQINHTYEDMRIDCAYLGAIMYRDEVSKFVLENYPELYDILINNENLTSFQLLFKLTKKEAGASFDELERLVKASYPDIVDMIGNALKGREIKQTEKKIGQNEKLQYERMIAELEKELSEARKCWEECANNWKAAVDANEHLEKELSEARKCWEECADNWKAAAAAADERAYENDELKETFEKRESSLKNKINTLYLRIDEIESNLNPIMERDLELQKENNKFREERRKNDI